MQAGHIDKMSLATLSRALHVPLGTTSAVQEVILFWPEGVFLERLFLEETSHILEAQNCEGIGHTAV